MRELEIVTFLKDLTVFFTLIWPNLGSLAWWQTTGTIRLIPLLLCICILNKIYHLSQAEIPNQLTFVSLFCYFSAKTSWNIFRHTGKTEGNTKWKVRVKWLISNTKTMPMRQCYGTATKWNYITVLFVKHILSGFALKCLQITWYKSCF